MAFRDTRNKQFLTANTPAELQIKIDDYVKRGWKVISPVRTVHGQYSTYKVLVQFTGDAATKQG